MSTSSNKLGGLDLVVSVTQDAINYQLQQLHRQRIIHDRLDVVMANTGVELHADLASPILHIGAKGTQATFVLRMPRGQLKYWEGFGPSATARTLEFKDWSYAFDVGLDLQALSAKALSEHRAIPPEVKAHLESFNGAMFSIRHLFMDFQNADLVTFDAMRTQMSLPDGTKVTPNQMTQFQMSIRNYFAGLKGTTNPYILGYTVEPLADAGEPSPFDPTGSTFSTFANPKDQGTSTLNFLLMTRHRALPEAPTLAPYVDGRVPPQDYDGRFIIGRRAFFEEWFLPRVRASLDENLSNRNNPNIDFENVLTEVEHGWTLANRYSAKVQFKDGEVDTEERRHTTTISFKNSSASAVQLDLAGHLEDTFDATVGFFRQHQGVSVSIDWTASVTITAGRDGQLVLTRQMDPQEPKKTFRGGVTEQNRKSLQIIEGRIEARLKKVLADLGIGSLSGRVVMPAGGVFFFKNPQLDVDGNLYLDVSFKA